MKTITSRHNTIVAMFRAAARASRRDRIHLLLDGARLIDEACRSGVPMHAAMFSAAALERGDPVMRRLALAAEAAGAEVVAGSDSVLAAVSPVRAPSGAVALAAHRPSPWGDVVDRARAGLVVTAVGVQDPGNVGAIVRTADAGGARGVIVTGSSADPFGWRALRGAMGSSFRVPLAVADSARAVLERAQATGARILAAVPRGGQSLLDVDLAGPRLLLVGPEGEGLEPRLESAADIRVSIPMRRGVDSLNVAVAVALFIYEARRQRVGNRRGAVTR